MTESTKIEITKEQLDSLLLIYYKKYFQDENITLSRIISSDSYEDDIVITQINRKVKIGNYEADKQYGLNYEEIKNVINEDLEKYGYKVSSFDYQIINKKISGISVIVNKLEKVKQKTL